MAKYYYVAETKYDTGESNVGKQHKDARRCYEELRIMMNKASTDHLVSIGVNRYEKA